MLVRKHHFGLFFRKFSSNGTTIRSQIIKKLVSNSHFLLTQIIIRQPHNLNHQLANYILRILFRVVHLRLFEHSFVQIFTPSLRFLGHLQKGVPFSWSSWLTPFFQKLMHISNLALHKINFLHHAFSFLMRQSCGFTIMFCGHHIKDNANHHIQKNKSR